MRWPSDMTELPEDSAPPSAGILDLALPLARRWRALVLTPIVAGLLGYAATYLITPTFQSTATILPPQQQGNMASALASLSAATGGLAGSLGVKTPADQYVALMQSVTVTDRIIDQFHLMQVYELRFRDQARKALAKAVQIAASKKDGIISIEVTDADPKRAADMANRYVDELRRLTAVLAVSEAQQRRVFFEAQLKETKDRLAAAQVALQSSGFNPGAINSEPRAAADLYARARAEAASADVRLQALRGSLTDASPQVQQQLATVQALHEQLRSLEESNASNRNGPDFVTKYREYKYQETLFDLLARQYEMARFDEAREGALIQVVDVAQPAERKYKPARMLTGLGIAIAATFLFVMKLLLAERWRLAARRPEVAHRLEQLRRSFRRGGDAAP